MDKVNLILEANAEVYVETIQDGLEKIGLKSSNLYKSVKQEVKDGVLKISMFDYAKYVVSGRKVGARKVPISALIEWIKRKGLTPKTGQSVNSLAFAIQTSIYKEGIKARPFIPVGATAGLVRNISKQMTKLTIDYINVQITKYNTRKK